MRAYLQVLIWMMLFVLMIEMIFPDNSYRKYIKLILGCILVYTLMQPIVRFVSVEGKDYDAYVRLYEQKLGTYSGEIVSAYETERESQQKSLEKVYEEGMTSLVENELDVKVSHLALVWQDGEVVGIDMTVGEGETESGFAISPIQIGDKSESVAGDEEKLKNKIKTCLNNFYNVQVCNIHITVQKK